MKREVMNFMEKIGKKKIQTSTIKSLIKDIKKKKKYPEDIPEEYRDNHEIIVAERKAHMRRSLKRGYEVIHNAFYVEEAIAYRYGDGLHEEYEETDIRWFSDFDSFYEYLDGEIYSDSCYYQYQFPKNIIRKYRINQKKICTSAFIDYSIDEYNTRNQVIEDERYISAEKRKVYLKKWIDRFDACSSLDQFKKELSKLQKSTSIGYEDFIIDNYISAHLSETQWLIDLANNISSLSRVIPLVLLMDNDPEKIIAAYSDNTVSNSSRSRYKKKLKDTAEMLKNGNITIKTDSFFDSNTHFYCVEDFGLQKGSSYPVFSRKKYFDCFDDFADFLNGNLSGCDLSCAKIPDFDVSKYTIDDKTRLPNVDIKNCRYSIQKVYNRHNKKFEVNQYWLGDNDVAVKTDTIKFEFFVDFVHFLKGDLSGADFIFCDGISNLTDISDINLTDVMLTSWTLKNARIKQTKYEVSEIDVESFTIPFQYEKETLPALETTRELLNWHDIAPTVTTIDYITDLHLMHRLRHAGCKTLTDAMYTIGQAIDDMLSTKRSKLLLIGGDTASDYRIFELFVKMLRKTLDSCCSKVQVVFLLGNHELWNYPGKTIDEISIIYRKLLVENNMYLLQNEILFSDSLSFEDAKYISSTEILNENKDEIREKVSKARIILFGGIGFSGYNSNFNADNGIYRNILNRQEECQESRRCEEIYQKVLKIIPKRRVIVFTHMPLRDWCADDNKQIGYIYISGHTHRNYFYDDGDIRIYTDNQIGYRCGRAALKCLYYDGEYNPFEGYEDGIYSISREKYIDFYRGKKIEMSFSRKISALYLLKKNGYYCFISANEKGKLSVLNGGTGRKVTVSDDIRYYYLHMDEVIARIKEPLTKYTQYQEKIVQAVRKFGGYGTIHGAIIDIDFLNHIYVNPVDMKVTPYWAKDIQFKKVYPNVESLLKANCPKLYVNYQRLTSEGEKNELSVIYDEHKIESRGEYYFETDIYRASREIKKMQKLNNSILSVWLYENYDVSEDALYESIVVKNLDTLEIVDKSKYLPSKKLRILEKAAIQRKPKQLKIKKPTLSPEEKEKRKFQKAAMRVEERSLGKLKLLSYTGSKDPATFLCLNCGKQFTMRMDHVFERGGCRYCCK
jgi:predicted MPP superfamily phosphohydrolase